MFQTKKAAPFTGAYVNHLRGANTHVAAEEFQSTICSPGREFATLVKNLIAIGVITAAFVGIAVEATTPKPRKPAQQVSDELRNRVDGVGQRLAAVRPNLTAPTK